MSYTPEQKSAAEMQSAAIIQRLGLTKPKNEWSYEERYQYNKEFATFIRDSELFNDAETMQTASNVASADFQPLDEFGAAEAIKIFGDEFLNQAQEINPLSTVNRGKTANVIIGAILLGAVAYFGVLAWSSKRNIDLPLKDVPLK